MPEIIDPDALNFAKLRAAHLEPPRQVGDDLLAAAAQPTIRLKDVTPFQARMRAAEVLIAGGDRVGALELAGSDPRLPEPLSAFTSSAAEHQKPVRWPPGRLDRCWCGSGLRYSRCCGAASGPW